MPSRHLKSLNDVAYQCSQSWKLVYLLWGQFGFEAHKDPLTEYLLWAILQVRPPLSKSFLCLDSIKLLNEDKVME
jgi:hypothetical protein